MSDVVSDLESYDDFGSVDDYRCQTVIIAQNVQFNKQINVGPETIDQQKNKENTNKNTKLYNKFQKNVAILSNYFVDINRMSGIIVKIEVEDSYNNYTNIFGDPAKEQTLQICNTDNLMLFYKTDDKGRIPKRWIMKGVTVLTHYKLTVEDIVRIAYPPAILPVKLEKHVFSAPHDITQLFKEMELTDMETFLNRHYVRGDMTSLSAMIRKPGWQRSFRNSVEVKSVALCRFCRKRALKGCCDKYNAANRTTVLMVLGWVEK